MIMMRNILENQGRSMCIECVRTSTASVIMKGLSSKMMAPTAASAAAKLASSCTVQRTCMTAAHSRHCWPRMRATCPAASTADCHPRTVAAAHRSLEGVPACAASGLKYGCTRLHLRVPVLHTATICMYFHTAEGWGQAAELRSKQLDIISPPGFLFPIYSIGHLAAID